MKNRQREDKRDIQTDRQKKTEEIRAFWKNDRQRKLQKERMTEERMTEERMKEKRMKEERMTVERIIEEIMTDERITERNIDRQLEWHREKDRKERMTDRKNDRR